MRATALLVCYCSLMLPRPGAGTHTPAMSECPSLDAAKLAKIKSLVITQDVHHLLEGNFRDLWGSKAFYDEDPDTCIKYSKEVVNEKELNQTVSVRGKWFGGEHTRSSSLQKVENGVYLEVLHNLPNGPDFVIGKVYLLYAKNNVFVYFWCMMYTPPANKKESEVPWVSAVAVRPQDLSPLTPAVQAAINEAVLRVQQHKDILGEIVRFTDSC